MRSFPGGGAPPQNKAAAPGAIGSGGSEGLIQTPRPYKPRASGATSNEPLSHISIDRWIDKVSDYIGLRLNEVDYDTATAVGLLVDPESGLAAASLDHIAHAVGRSRSTTRRSLRRLVAVGLLGWHRGNGRGHQSVFRPIFREVRR